MHAAYESSVNRAIVQLLTEGVAIRGVARILRISATTVISRIRTIARKISKQIDFSRGNIYEIDETWTYVGRKNNEVWITYAIDRLTKQVIDFVVGPRTKERLSIITTSVLALVPTKICTDGLMAYQALVPPVI